MLGLTPRAIPTKATKQVFGVALRGLFYVSQRAALPHH